MNIPLSVLDLSPISAGQGAARAVCDTVELAQLAERLGYYRYWVAEHHNIPSVASTAPEIMIGQIASRTSRIRVGSGGVMLPNHAPLRVAETFHVLEALYPGRIDLGIGRAPGTDQLTALALRRSRKGSAPRISRRSSLSSLASAVGNYPMAIRSPAFKSFPPMSRCRRSGCLDRPKTAHRWPQTSVSGSPSRIISIPVEPSSR
jgi:luciferase family oxidoreductase group 1